MPSDRPTTPHDELAASPLPVDALAAPLAGSSPCGPDLEYDPAFEALQKAAAGLPERQYGESVYAAEPPDWPKVRRQARALAGRTRDLRVTVWLVRAEARVAGIRGAIAALTLLRVLLENQWAAVHPPLDAQEADDPAARLNAIYPLHHANGLADLRAAAVATAPGRPPVTARDLELAYGGAEPDEGETSPKEPAVRAALAAALVADATLHDGLREGLVAVHGIAAALDTHLGAGRSPELAPLLRLMQALVTAADAAAPGASTATGAAAAAEGSTDAIVVPANTLSTAVARGEIRSRADAIRALERVCDWLEANEPTHPAPILIQRAQRLLAKKNFLEIIRDLVPDGLGQIEKLAGPPGD